MSLESYERRKHTQKFITRRREYDKKRSKQVRETILKLLGNKCASCGITDPRVLQIDHINGNAYQQRKIFKNRKKSIFHFILKEILNGSKEYQLLCANCNWIKRHERQEYGGKEKEFFIDKEP